MKRAALLLGLMALTGCAITGEPPVLADATDPAMTGRYQLSGAVELRPVRIADDGTHTYIVWAEDQALPAVFAISAVGAEEMVDGYMRNDVFTIDRIHKQLVFRIDKKLARAERVGQ
jgi:type IV secretory pathway VirB9-like protein